VRTPGTKLPAPNAVIPRVHEKVQKRDVGVLDAAPVHPPEQLEHALPQPHARFRRDACGVRRAYVLPGVHEAAAPAHEGDAALAIASGHTEARDAVSGPLRQEAREVCRTLHRGGLEPVEDGLLALETRRAGVVLRDLHEHLLGEAAVASREEDVAAVAARKAAEHGVAAAAQPEAREVRVAERLLRRVRRRRLPRAAERREQHGAVGAAGRARRRRWG
jgi:hypothetical protein